jgi:biotin/methionine sulfoxide reductase
VSGPGDGWRPHSSHWGAFSARQRGGAAGIEVRPHPEDPAPSALLGNIPDAPDHPTRVTQPMVRRGWLQDGPGATDRRGRDPFVAVGWDEAIALVAGELARVRSEHGASAIYAGSYGWSSAGRFHHAQSQVRRFFGLVGGATTSRNSYSAAAAEVILPHVFGDEMALTADTLTWDGIAHETATLVAFGGMARRNQMVGPGGATRHVSAGAIAAARQRGAQLVVVGPIRDDLLGAEWIPLRPGTDVALMLALAWVLRAEGLHDTAFLARWCDGFDAFADYLTGRTDGLAKDPAWAAAITGVAPERIVALARQMAAGPTVVTVANGVQRAEHGEQPIWMGVVLSAMLGRFGPGAGFASALGGMANWGRRPLAVRPPSLPRRSNPVTEFIPVARIADMLLQPGAPYDYDGRRRSYPDVRLVYWAGGNPFHHHQDLNRLRQAWGRPETIVVHEPHWTATARHADVVLPATITMERDDIGGGANDPALIAMRRIVEPHGQARDDYAIFAALAAALDPAAGAAFTEGRTAAEWVRHLYGAVGEQFAALGLRAPSFDRFWADGALELPTQAAGTWLDGFLADPEAHPLATPSGRIQISSPTIAALRYPDCPGHPTWLEKAETLTAPLAARFPLQLIANQPSTRLHSQLDFGATSRNGKIAGREAARLHPADAAARGIATGDVVRLFNDRGACLAGAILTDTLMPGIVQLPTGAWYDPDDALGVCRHGNPNALTRDVGSSRLAQATTGQLALVEVERWSGPVPPIRVHTPPPIEPRDQAAARPGASSERAGTISVSDETTTSA